MKNINTTEKTIERRGSFTITERTATLSIMGLSISVKSYITYNGTAVLSRHICRMCARRYLDDIGVSAEA